MPNFSEKLCGGIQNTIRLFSVPEVVYSPFFDSGSKSQNFDFFLLKTQKYLVSFKPFLRFGLVKFPVFCQNWKLNRGPNKSLVFLCTQQILAQKSLFWGFWSSICQLSLNEKWRFLLKNWLQKVVFACFELPCQDYHFRPTRVFPT